MRKASLLSYFFRICFSPVWRNGPASTNTLSGTWNFWQASKNLLQIRLVLGLPKAVNLSTCTINSSRRFMAKHICDLYELIRSNSETNLQRNWKEVENRVKTQLPLRVMSCVQLASKLTSHYKVKSRNSYIKTLNELLLCPSGVQMWCRN